MQSLVKLVQRVGPYVVMAIVLPGGTFVALGLYFYRRRQEGWDPAGSGIRELDK